MADKSDICIIGGGVVGLFTALLLAREGKTVCVIDKTYAASSRYNIGELAPNGADSTLTPLIQLSQKIWMETPGVENESLGVKLRGRLEFVTQENIENIIKDEIEKENTKSIPTAYLERDKLHTILSKHIDAADTKANMLRLGTTVIGAKYIPEEPVIATKTALSKLKAAVIQAGVKVWGSDEVADFISEGDKIIGVRTTQGDECLSDHTIITAGVYVGKLLSKLNINLPIRPARCHILHVTPNDVVPEELMMFRSRYGQIYMKTNRHGRMMLTYDGLADAQQATYTIAPNPATTMWLQAEAARLLPALANARVQEQTTVLLSVTPDYLPCIGKLKGYQNLSVAIGMGGRSFALSAGTAECLKNLIVGKETPVDLTPFSPTRFQEKSWQKTRMPSNLAATSEFIAAPPPTIKMVEKHVETLKIESELERSADVEMAEFVNMTGKNIQENKADIIHGEGGRKDVERADEVHLVGHGQVKVAGEVGFKESSKKPTVGKLS